MNPAEEKTFYTVHEAIKDIRKGENSFLDNVIFFYYGAWFIAVLFFFSNLLAYLRKRLRNDNKRRRLRNDNKRKNIFKSVICVVFFINWMLQSRRCIFVRLYNF